MCHSAWSEIHLKFTFSKGFTWFCFFKLSRRHLYINPFLYVFLMGERCKIWKHLQMGHWSLVPKISQTHSQLFCQHCLSRCQFLLQCNNWVHCIPFIPGKMKGIIAALNFISIWLNYNSTQWKQKRTESHSGVVPHSKTLLVEKNRHTTQCDQEMECDTEKLASRAGCSGSKFMPRRWCKNSLTDKCFVFSWSSWPAGRHLQLTSMRRVRFSSSGQSIYFKIFTKNPTI